MSRRALGSIALLLFAAGCPARETVDDQPPEQDLPARADASASEVPGEEDGPTGLVFAVQEAAGFEIAEGAARPEVAEGEPLGQAEAERLLSRLPPLEDEADDIREFALRKGSMPAPRTGETEEATFPPLANPHSAPAAPEAGPLEVLRRQPEGDVPVAPKLSVTFSQPMVAVTSHDTLSREEVPVRLEPKPVGTWRWIGTKTLLFEPEGRFPMATTYRAEVPAGTTSRTGGELEEAVRWTFSTPPPRVVRSWPRGGPQRRDAPMFLEFDQRIEPEAVLETITVESGPRRFATRLLEPAELEEHDAVGRLSEAAEEGRWLALRATDPLPPDADVQVSVGPGTPSAEGPATNDEVHRWSFRTFGAFEVVRARCGWQDECRPGQGWRVEFTNPVDPDSLSADRVTVEPELPGLRVSTWGDQIQIQGRSQGRTTYAVRLDPSLRDRFGQSLGASKPLWIEVGPAQPVLAAQGNLLTVADPALPARFPVMSVNHPKLEVRLWKVAPGDWGGFLDHVRTALRREGTREMPGELVVDRAVEPGGEPDRMVETWIDLGPALDDGHGHVVVEVKPPASLLDKLKGRRPPVIRRWVQVTDLGLDAFVDRDEMVAWVSELGDGAPVGGAHLSLSPGDATARTDAEGLARLPLADTSPEQRGMLLARRGSDTVMLPDHVALWGDRTSWRKTEPTDTLRWYVADDRHMYKPGETVRVKGWIRRIGGGPDGDVTGPEGAVDRVSWKAFGPRGNELAEGEERLSDLGGFDLSFALPDDANLGHARVAVRSRGGAITSHHSHHFQVQEFRRPEFEVSAGTDTGPHRVGGDGTARVRAGYYAGGPLPGAKTTWVLTPRPASYTPPNRDEWTFGVRHPWFGWFSRGGGGERPEPRRLEGETDATGEHAIRVDFEATNPPRPFRLEARATVMDVNRQAWTDAASFLVHPGEVYVGLKTPRAFVQAGEAVQVDALAVDLEGEIAAGRPVTVSLARLDWRQRGGEWEEEVVDEQRCAITSGADEDGVRCSFEPEAGGRHRLRATVTDDAGRANRTETTVWVAGGRRPPSREVEMEEVRLIPDRERYADGDVAEILVQAPFEDAEGLVTVRRSGLVRTERFTVEGTSATVRVPIEDAFVPNVHVTVDLVGAAPRVDADGELKEGAPPRPAFASGSVELKVPPVRRALHVDVTPEAAEVAPGVETAVDLRLRDAEGAPVEGAEVALVVVDEAVLALSGYALPDPLEIFYTARQAGVRAHHLRSRLLLGEPEIAQPTDTGAGADADARPRGAAEAEGVRSLAQPMKASRGSGTGADMDDGSDAGGAPIDLREDFRALALFAPDVPTDAEGRARVPFELPDDLTRYRVMAVAVDGERRFGRGESTITARLPLMVRPSPPRFLNYGDRFELPVVLQNQTGEAMEVAVAVRSTNAGLTGAPGRRVEVPARDRVEVRFPTETRSAGTARFQAAAATDAGADAASFQIPVWTPATTEAFATYGTIEEGAVVQPVRAPEDAVRAFGGLEVTTSSTQLQALTDAFLYLVGYPFDCAEQLSSRVLAVAALKDVLAAFEAEGLPEPDAIRAAVDRDLTRLERLQNPDGGWGFWRRGESSRPYVSVHVAHALVRAAAGGFEVPERTNERAMAYLRTIADRFPAEYPEVVRRVITAYALYVRDLGGDPDPTGAKALIEEAGGLTELPLEAVAWIYPVLSGEGGFEEEIGAIRRHLQGRVTETAAGAHFATGYTDGGHLLLHSDRRVDGVVLEGLLEDRPDSDLVPKIVRGLLAHRDKGRWSNTQENAFVLLALNRYFHAYESVTPDFVARVWLGDGFAGEHRFEGRTTERHHVAIPMAAVAEAGEEPPLILDKDGAGRMYYRVGMRYAPKDLDLEPADHGFTVQRRYEAVDDPEDVRRDADGAWRVRAGARVRATVTMVAPTRRYHVALVDPLPAGFEAINPDLAVSAAPRPPDDGAGPRGSWGRWWGPWYEHQNLRDERAEAFSTLVWEGVHTYTWVARATTPGRFVVPPPKAEEMYHPETFGRGASATVIVE